MDDKSARIEALRREAASCRACPLWKNATQTVFGEGPAEADILFVGEQPGDREDRAGRPFVDPAGLMLDKALEEAGVDRNRAYLTNAVKHFKFEPRGKLRLHKKPNAREINVCKRWLFGEIDVLQPRLIVALGATAAQKSRWPSRRHREEPRRRARAGKWVAGVRDGASVVSSARARRTAPGDLDFETLMERVRLQVHLGLYYDETAAASTWHLLMPHPLESWSDIAAPDGAVSIVQPLIRPLHESYSAHRLLAALTSAGEEVHSEYDRVRGAPGARVGERRISTAAGTKRLSMA